MLLAPNRRFAAGGFRDGRVRDMKRRFLAWAFASVLLMGSAYASSWSETPSPSPGPARVIGAPANGCIAGAAALPFDGVGYQAIRISRRRYFSHPETVDFVERLGRRATALGLAPFYVGDMSQPRGGPLPEMHVSHQNGVDVDIWFNLDPKPALAPEARETVDLPSMILPDGSAIDPARFGRRQVRLLRLAASDKRVDRILVHPAIKRALCAGVGGARSGDRSWLRRIRPWYGHDEHFHVRLACPADSPLCVQQAPVPPGDGCEQEIFDWWSAELSRPRVPQPPRAPPELPEACRALEVIR